MKSYHKNHPDPDIRRKYAEWEKAYYASNATGGHGSAEAAAEAKRKKKAARMSIGQLLQTLGGQSVKGSNIGLKTSAKQADKRKASLRRTGGQRGS